MEEDSPSLLDLSDDSPSLLDLSDDVICVLLRYLDATSLYLLGRTCTRLDELIRGHRTLWRRIDARRAPNNLKKTFYCLERCYDDGNSWTRSFLTRDEGPIVSAVLSKINSFSRLSILAFENVDIIGAQYSAIIFPPQLHELSLKKTTVANAIEFFRGTGKHFPNLRVLILDYCNWLTSCAFMPISKYTSLEILSIYKCRKVDNSVAYLSLSAQGFKALKIFDARLTLLGNALIRAMYRIKSLLALYFHNQDLSYKLDYFRRKLEIAEGSAVRDFVTEDSEFVVDDEDALNYVDTGTTDDIGLLDYLLVHSEPKVSNMPKSVLYLDPYRTCTCGYEDNQKKKYEINSEENHPGDDDDDDDHSGDDDSALRLIKNKITRLTKLIIQSRTGENYNRGLPNDHDLRTNPSMARSFISSVGSFIATFDEMFNVGEEIHRPQENGHNSNSSYIINVYLHPPGASSSSEESPEPPAKRARTEDPLPGPSGVNNAADSSSDSEIEIPPAKRPSHSDIGEEPPPGQRPPTPHPDVAPPERVQVFAPAVHIEDSIVRKNTKVPLRRLSLRGYKKITNSALKYFKDLDLDLLDVTYTSVTAEGIETYLRSHPLCRVVHEQFCTCPVNLHF